MENLTKPKNPTQSDAVSLLLKVNSIMTNTLDEMEKKIEELTKRIEDIEYTPFNSDGTPDTTITPSESDQVLDNEFKDHKFSVSGLQEFTSFQIKFVFTGTNSCLPARIKDLRGIALAV